MISLHSTHQMTITVAPRRADSASGSNASNKPTNSVRTVTEPAETQLLRQLASRDREVRSHEQAHASAAGGLAHGGPSFTYTRGPDGRQYATGGEVNIDVSPVANDPAATAAKAQKIRRAALAPANPSQQDRAVAARATAMASEARVELQRQALDENSTSGEVEQDPDSRSERGQEVRQSQSSANVEQSIYPAPDEIPGSPKIQVSAYAEAYRARLLPERGSERRFIS